MCSFKFYGIWLQAYTCTFAVCGSLRLAGQLVIILSSIMCTVTLPLKIEPTRCTSLRSLARLEFQEVERSETDIVHCDLTSERRDHALQCTSLRSLAHLEFQEVERSETDIVHCDLTTESRDHYSVHPSDH